MKTIIKTALFSAAMLFAVQGMAATMKTDTTKVGKAVRKVGHKTANVASNTAAYVTDKKYHEKRGPHGETIYINKHSHYYYINKKGHRVYLTKDQLRDEKED
jgi:archaellum component FlaG (FlaF/FlaG flagellin family)